MKAHPLYHFLISAYGFFIRFASLFSPKAKMWVSGRKKWKNTLTEKVPTQPRPTIWVHCASLGEFEQAKPVIELLRAVYPEHFFLLTFFSPSGFENAKKYTHVDHIAYLPLDTLQNARDFLSIVKPQMALFVKYEFWHNYLYALTEKQIPFIYFSVIFRPNHYLFRYGKRTLQLLKQAQHIFVQNEESLQLLEQQQFKNCSQAGDTRFDRVLTIASEDYQLEHIAHFTKEKKTIVAGSTWSQDDDLLINALSNLKDFRLIIAPHEVHSKNIQRLQKSLESASIHYQLYSEYEVSSASSARVLIIDQIGLLSRSYRYATIGYVGGGFGKGIHNILEVLAHCKPVLFGPEYKKFNEAHQALAASIAQTVSSSSEFVSGVEKFIETYPIFEQNCKSFLAQNKGSSTKIKSYLLSLATS